MGSKTLQGNDIEHIIGFKGFNKDLKCREKQYKIGEEATEEEAILCKKGIHFCENPHDVFGYYSAGEGNRFCKVEAKETTDEKEDDSKRVCKRLFIKAEISAFDICKIAVSSFFENFGFLKKINSTETNNAGDKGAANAGDKGAANAGNKGAANAGNYGAANAGDYGAANAGDKGAANAGNYGAANAGKSGVAIASNYGKVRGGIGSVLVLVNREYSEEHKCYMVNDFASTYVDGIKIKSDTWYILSNGNFQEVE